jgi:sRNA-binding protein
MRCDIAQTLQVLYAKYPKAFFENRQQRLPLKSTILRDLERDESFDNLALLEEAVKYYQSDIGYQYAVAHRTPVVDLDGKIVANITESASYEAYATIKQIKRKLAERYAYKNVVRQTEPRATTRLLHSTSSVLAV